MAFKIYYKSNVMFLFQVSNGTFIFHFFYMNMKRNNLLIQKCWNILGGAIFERINVLF